ncbi:hypothetical protein IWW38_004394, partial [Coemansia aciculifera]
MNGFRYSVYETSDSSLPPPAKTSGGGSKLLATVKRLFCFGRRHRTVRLDPTLRMGSSTSRMNLALAVAEQYVLVSLDNPLDPEEFSQTTTIANTTPVLHSSSSPMSGTSDGTLLNCDPPAHTDGCKSP